MALPGTAQPLATNWGTGSSPTDLTLRPFVRARRAVQCCSVKSSFCRRLRMPSKTSLPHHAITSGSSQLSSVTTARDLKAQSSG